MMHRSAGVVLGRGRDPIGLPGLVCCIISWQRRSGFCD